MEDRPLLGERCNDQTLILDALGQVAECGVQTVCDAIETGECSLSEKERKLRTWCAAMLNKLPVTCITLRDRMRADPRYVAVMFYERTRLGAASSGHFLEGLAGGLPLFSGPTALSLPDDDLQKLRLRDVVADRIRTVSSLELLTNDSVRLKQLIGEYTLTDLPPGLPGRVHVFVSRMRGICQGLWRIKPENNFKSCKNCECNRKFYMGTPVEASANAPSGVLSKQQSGSIDPVDAYWDMAAGTPEIKDEQREFCTYSCCLQWRWQLKNAMPEMSPDVMIADYQCRKEGRQRVPEALRKCAKRNEAASRHLRIIEKERRTFPAIAKADLRVQRMRRVTMLNIDLGLVYTASVLAESKSLSSNKVLPGASEGWRSRPMFYAKALKTAMAMYKKHHVGGNVIANLLVHEPFLVKLKEKASKVI